MDRVVELAAQVLVGIGAVLAGAAALVTATKKKRKKR